MPRVKRFKDDAERLKAWRARKAGVTLEDAEAARLRAGASERVPDEIDLQIAKAIREAEAINRRLPQKTPTISEQEYVELELDKAITEPQRKARAERYLRWRYRGYCAGVVAAL